MTEGPIVIRSPFDLSDECAFPASTLVVPFLPAGLPGRYTLGGMPPSRADDHLRLPPGDRIRLSELRADARGSAPWADWTFVPLSGIIHSVRPSFWTRWATGCMLPACWLPAGGYSCMLVAAITGVCRMVGAGHFLAGWRGTHLLCTATSAATGASPTFGILPLGVAAGFRRASS
jgi:hypothetical protein